MSLFFLKGKFNDPFLRENGDKNLSVVKPESCVCGFVFLLFELKGWAKLTSTPLKTYEIKMCPQSLPGLVFEKNCISLKLVPSPMK